ncbi:MAG: hypothetical protein RRY21_03460, partial [Oscillospiraceae bacterium]
MKKLFALTLAVAMVLSLASVAFAAGKLETVDKVAGIAGPYLENDGVVDEAYDPAVGMGFGKTVYYPLYASDGTNPVSVYKSDAVKSMMKPKATWDVGESNVESVTVVKKKTTIPGANVTEYRYCVAVKIKDSTALDKTDVIGELTFKKASTNALTKDTVLAVNLSVGYGYSTEKTVKSTAKIFNFGTKGTSPLATSTDDELTLD